MCCQRAGVQYGTLFENFTLALLLIYQNFPDESPF